jgi:hypothetical protein
MSDWKKASCAVLSLCLAGWVKKLQIKVVRKWIHGGMGENVKAY